MAGNAAQLTTHCRHRISRRLPSQQDKTHLAAASGDFCLYLFSQIRVHIVTDNGVTLFEYCRLNADGLNTQDADGCNELCDKRAILENSTLRQEVSPDR